MAAGYLLALREGLEAALLVGLLLSALRRTGNPEMVRFAWLGVASAAFLSLAVGSLLTLIGTGLEGKTEAVFEGLTLALAVVVLTWVVIWMQGQRAATGAETEIRRAATAGQRWGVLLTSFVAVGREGLEIGLFVSAAALASDARLAIVGAGLGLLTATALGAGLHFTTIRLDLRRFFTVTSLLLVLFAAGLLVHGVHEFGDLGWIPGGSTPIWDSSALLPPSSVVGQAAAILFGYDPSPSLAQVVGYLGYLAIMSASLLVRRHRPVAPTGMAPDL